MSVNTADKKGFRIYSFNPAGDIYIKVDHASPSGGLPEGVQEYIAEGRPFYELRLCATDLSDFSALLALQDNVKRLGIECLDADWAVISQMTQLQELSIDQLTANCTLDFQALKQLRRLGLHWHKSYATLVHDLPQLKFLGIGGFGLETLEAFTQMPLLEFLIMDNSRKLKSLNGIEQFSNLAVLEMSANSMLGDIQSVVACQALERVFLNNNNRVLDYSPLKHLQRLEELIMWGKETDSIKWLTELPLLGHLSFGFKLVDQNLEFLYQMKNLKFIKFLDRRGQSHKLQEMRDYLEQKGFNQNELSIGFVRQRWT